MKRVRTDEIQLEKIVSETDEQISRLAHNQSKVEADIGKIFTLICFHKGKKSLPQHVYR